MKQNQMNHSAPPKLRHYGLYKCSIVIIIIIIILLLLYYYYYCYYSGYGLLAALTGRPAAQARWLSPKVGSHLAPFPYSSREPSEFSQWLSYDDSTINITQLFLYRPVYQSQASITA